MINNMSYNEWMNKNNLSKSNTATSKRISTKKISTILTNEEKYGINTYIGSKSYTINEKLRNGIEFDEYENKIVKGLDSALDKMENYEGIVTRSVCINSEDLGYFMKDYKSNNIVHQKAYTSATSGDNYNPEARIQMFIKSKTGKDIRSFNPEEQEILFKRDTNFLTKKVDATDDFYVKIYMEEV